MQPLAWSTQPSVPCIKYLGKEHREALRVCRIVQKASKTSLLEELLSSISVSGGHAGRQKIGIFPVSICIADETGRSTVSMQRITEHHFLIF